MSSDLTITETTEWPDTVHLIDTDEAVIGGEDGVSNKQAIALSSRSQWLLAQMVAVMTEAGLDLDTSETTQLNEAIEALTETQISDAQGNFRGTNSLSSDTTLAESGSGSLSALWNPDSSGTQRTMTLPACDDVAAGTMYVMATYSDTSGEGMLVVAADGGSIEVPMSGTLTKYAIMRGESAMFVSDGSSCWYCVPLGARTATTTRSGLVELATKAEALAGTDTDRAVTPAGVAAAISSASTTAVPTGAVVPYAMSSPPDGWLECDGSTLSRTTYSDLYDAIGTTFGEGDGSTTFALPDLRGQFVRGWDNGAGVDEDRTLGSSQDDAFQGHYHDVRNYDDEDTYVACGAGQASGGGVPYYSTLDDGADGGNLLGVGSPISDGTNGTPRTDSETRPVNVALMYCIKY